MCLISSTREQKNVSSKRPSADPTRTKILKASQKLFARNGFAGTSISDIANKAKINQSLIYHHFGSKEDLWKQVKISMCESFFGLSLKDITPKAKDFHGFLRHFVKSRFEFYDKYPDVRRMIVWERLESQPGKLYAANERSREILNHWREKIEYFQEKGEIRKELQPKLILIFMATTSLSFFLAEHSPLLEASEEEKQALKKQYIVMVTDCLWRALKGTNLE